MPEMDLTLYVIPDVKIGFGRSHVELAEETLKGGATVIQLRDKEKSGRELYSIGLELRKLTNKHGAMFIVNDRLDIALATGADGVHLGTKDLPISIARKIAGKNFIIGASVSSIDEAIKAEEDGADYLSVQSIFPTTSKEDVKTVGLELLKKIIDSTSLPVIAIGGINTDNICKVIKKGAKGVAVISAIVSKPDVKKATEELKRKIQTCLPLF